MLSNPVLLRTDMCCAEIMQVNANKCTMIAVAITAYVPDRRYGLPSSVVSMQIAHLHRRLHNVAHAVDKVRLELPIWLQPIALRHRCQGCVVKVHDEAQVHLPRMQMRMGHKRG